MPNTVTNTGIVAKSYNSRGLITHRANTSNLAVESDGTLWAAVRENTPDERINLYKSTNGGFSWTRVWAGGFTQPGFRTFGIAGLNQNGPFMHLQILEHQNRIVLFHSYLNTSTNKYNVQPFLFDATTGEQFVYTVDNPEDMPLNDELILDMDQLAFKAVYTELGHFLVFTSFSKLTVYGYQPAYLAVPALANEMDTTAFNIFDAVADPDASAIHIILLNEETLYYSLVYIRFDISTRTFTQPVEVGRTVNKTDLIVEPNIRIDGTGNLCAAWTLTDFVNADVQYSMSFDLGETWDAVTTIDPEAGQSVYRDGPTDQATARTVLLGGLQGFIIGYTRRTDSGAHIKSFIRTLITEDGEDYELSDEGQIAVYSEYEDADITGLKFFEPPYAKLLDLTDPGVARVGYQVGEGNVTTQNDTVPVEFGQELLSQSAYIITFDLDYQVDPVNPNQLLNIVTILAGPSENIDYYEAGAVGELTRRYMAAFEKVGTTVTIRAYEPNPNARMNDRSAYFAPEEFITKAVITPITYDFPFPANEESTQTFIERDMRKVHLPPDAHLGREFVLNAGNFLKRTVWTVLFDGNEYEISQVVPHFAMSQICNYSANAFVMGPGNDPFSRPVLPSET